jgi:hypothetical protein
MYKAEVKNVMEFFIDNTIVAAGDRVLQRSVGIAMDMKCAFILADLFFYPSGAEFIFKTLKLLLL